MNCIDYFIYVLSKIIEIAKYNLTIKRNDIYIQYIRLKIRIRLGKTALVVADNAIQELKKDIRLNIV